MYLSALLLGFFGSFHCLGMCAPIAFALGSRGSYGTIIGQKIVYNLGRTLTYSILGIFAGVLGSSIIWLTGYQVYLTALIGLTMIGLGIFSVNPDKTFQKLTWLNGFFLYIRSQLAHYLRVSGWKSHFLVGLLNGFLPCGMVYVALAGALATGELLTSGVYMFFFGLGTLPMMLGAAVAGNRIGQQTRSWIRRLYPVLFVSLGIFLVIRAFNLQVKQNTDTHQPLPAVICH